MPWWGSLEVKYFLEGGVKDKDQGEDDDNEDTHAESHSDACENSPKKHGPSRSINGVNE
jgi:hypothetical protein